MWINCIIVSENILIHHKLNGYVEKTHFLTVSTEKKQVYDNCIIFWDCDSIDIDTMHLEQCIHNGSIVFIISSVFSKEIVLAFFSEGQRAKVSVVHKKINYNQFIEELSRITDLSNS